MNCSRLRPGVFASGFLGFLMLAIHATAQDSPLDPAAPEVRSVFQMKAPLPTPHPNGARHGSPKPLLDSAQTEDWPMFLGPRHRPHSEETELLKQWGEEGPELIWEVQRGESYASPSVLGDRVVHFHRVGDQEIIECLHGETGQAFWTYAYATDYEDSYGFGTGPKCAPALTSDRVVTYGIQGKLHCLHLLTGEVVWKRDLKLEFDIPDLFFGVGASPILYGDHIIINVGGTESPCVSAFSVKTGRLVWIASDKSGASYASPVIATLHSKPRVLVLTGGKSRPTHGGLLSIDPAHGEIDFRFPFRGRRYESANATSPVVYQNSVMISSSYNTGSACLEINEDFQPRLLWQTDDFGSHFGTGHVQDGCFFGIDGMASRTASIVCLDWKNGEELWRERPEWDEIPGTRSPRTKGVYSLGLGSLLWADGHVLALGEYGHLMWLKMNREGLSIISKAWIFEAPETWTPPVLSKGLLYVCQNQDGPDGGRRLRCYDLRGE